MNGRQAVQDRPGHAIFLPAGPDHGFQQVGQPRRRAAFPYNLVVLFLDGRQQLEGPRHPCQPLPLSPGFPQPLPGRVRVVLGLPDGGPGPAQHAVDQPEVDDGIEPPGGFSWCEGEQEGLIVLGGEPLIAKIEK